MAARQVQRLEDRDLYLLTGTEAEFCLFPADADIHAPGLKAAHNTINMYLPQHYRQYEKFFVEMDRRMRSLGFKFTKFHTEYGCGQMEMPLSPEEGLQAADNLVRFKLLARSTAADAGYRCSFMTKPMPRQTGNGFHFNHSVWRRHAADAERGDESQSDENVLLDERDPQKVRRELLCILRRLLASKLTSSASCRSPASLGAGSRASCTTARPSRRSSLPPSTATAVFTILTFQAPMIGPSTIEWCQSESRTAGALAPPSSRAAVRPPPPIPTSCSRP